MKLLVMLAFMLCAAQTIRYNARDCSGRQVEVMHRIHGVGEAYQCSTFVLSGRDTSFAGVDTVSEFPAPSDTGCFKLNIE